MKSTSKKLVSIFLALIMVTCLMPTNVLLAAASSAIGHYETYSVALVSIDEDYTYSITASGTQTEWVSNFTLSSNSLPNSYSATDKSTWTGRSLLKSYNSSFVDAYDTIYDAVENGAIESKEFNFTNGTATYLVTAVDLTSYNITIDEIDVIFDAYQTDHPEHFWRTGQYVMSYAEDGGVYYITSIYVQSYYSASEVTAKKALFDSATTSILAGINDNMTEYEKAKYIHDELAREASYDDEMAEITSTSQITESNKLSYYDAHSAYGIIVNKTGVCDSYARAYEYLLRQVGIECYYVVGTAGGSHAWNLVNLDGAYYYTDVTWDDVIIEYPSDYAYEKYYDGENIIIYGYFNMSDADLTRGNHTLQSSEDGTHSYYSKMPACTATTDAYYVLNAETGYDNVVDASDVTGTSYTSTLAYYMKHQSDGAVRLRADSSEMFASFSNWMNTYNGSSTNLYVALGSAFGEYANISKIFCTYNNGEIYIRFDVENSILGSITYDAVTKDNPTTVSLYKSGVTDPIESITFDKFDSTYCFGNLTDGTYTVKAQKTGCTTFTSSDIVISNDVATTCNINLLKDASVHVHNYNQKVVQAKFLKSGTTCEDAAVYYYSCSCGLSSEGTDDEATFESGEASGHNYGEWQTYSATQHKRICQNDSNHVEYANHNWNSGEVTKIASNLETGVMTYTCTDCGATKTENISKVNLSDYISVSPTKLTIQNGGTGSFTIKLKNADGKIDVSSSNTSVASITSATTFFIDCDLNPTQTITIKANKVGTTQIKVNLTDVSTADARHELIGTYTIDVTVTNNPNGNVFTSGKTSIRYYGESRYNTSFATANALKTALGVSAFNTIILADGTNFADALAGSYLAAKTGAPILMVNAKNGADDSSGAKTYIKNNLASGGKIYVLGGENAISKTFYNYLVKTYGSSKVVRLAGETRYETNIKILNAAGGVSGQELLICDGSNFADALSCSALGKPILLVDKNNVAFSSAQRTMVKSAKSVYIIGGTAAVPDGYRSLSIALGKTPTRVFGDTRYETSIAIANKFASCFAGKSTVIATGKNFPDGLSGGPLAYALGAPLILTSEDSYSKARSYVGSKNIVALGGTNALSDATVKGIKNATINVVKY